MYLDHIVWAVTNLDKGIKRFRDLTGIEPLKGGIHPEHGTQNALAAIGPKIYLEILAPLDDPSHCWMNLRNIRRPQIIRYAMRTTNLLKIKYEWAAKNMDPGEIISGSRKTRDGNLLTWELTDPDAHPDNKLIPFLIDWKNGKHPASKLEKKGKLLTLKGFHPQPDQVSHLLKNIAIDLPISFGKQPKLSVELSTPRGIVTL